MKRKVFSGKASKALILSASVLFAVTAIPVGAESFSTTNGTASVNYTAEANTKLQVPKTITPEVVSNTSIKVTWSKLTKANGYRLYRKAAGGAWKVVKRFDSKTTLSYTDTGLTSGTTYYYTVQGYMTVNGERVWGSRDTKGVSVKLEIVKPDAVTKVTTEATADSIKVSWNAVSKADGYQLWKKVGTGSWKKVGTLNATTYTDKDVAGGKTYTYRVRAYINNNGKKAFGAYGISDARKMEAVKPDNVKSITAAGVVSSVSVSWDKAANADGYQLWRKVGTGAWKKIGLTDKTEYTDTNVVSGKNYTYRVRAYKKDGAGNNIFSDYAVSEATKVGAKLDAPVLTVSKKDTSAELSWKAIDDATGYQIYRSTDGKNFTLLKKITSGKTLVYNDTTVKAGKTYYYYARAYYKPTSGKTVYSEFSKTVSVAY